ncbi:MAG: hypothetical protein JWQ99_1316 [Blastococcus sp.]|jgi:hypothetical protein|nr:hypothetical protein [Blastococcus sp.]
MAPPPRCMQMVAASRDEASLAVRLYNDPAEPRSFESFVVHMHLAWLYLLHAEFDRDGTDFRYWRRDNPRILDKVDGEARRWELARCVVERWPSEKDPVRANLSFFIGLRNKIEHRYARQQQALAAVVGGQAQALLLNYEEELTSQFGTKVSLATRLRFPVFIGSFTEEGEKALRRLRTELPASLRTFISEYTASLDESVTNDPHYELRLRVFQELASKPTPETFAIQYTRWGDMTDDEREMLKDMGKKGLVVTKERPRNIVGHGLKKPKDVIAEVQAQIPFRFHQGHFKKAREVLNLRPPAGDPNPERTDEKYCIYDKLNDNYGYTPAYVKKLVRECNTEEGFRAFLGTAPQDKETGAWVGPPPPASIPPWLRNQSAPAAASLQESAEAEA